MIKQSFKKDIIKTNPISTLVDSYKKNMSMEFLTIKEYEAKYADKKATISVKIDGETCGIKFDGNNTITYTRGGFIRYDFPATKEFTDICKRSGIKEFTGLCELYAVDENDRPMSYLKSQSILKLPKTPEEESRLKILVFDVYSVNDNVLINNSIEERIKQITSLFKTDGDKVSSAQYFVNEDISKIDELWQKVIRPDQYGYEGLIIYLDDKIIKIKPILSFDMVIVALNRNKKDPELISAVVASFLDKDSIFRFHGKIGSGFSASDRKLLFAWAERNKVWEDETGQIWVDPFKEPLIIEVQGEEVNIKEKPAYQFDQAEKEWIRVEDRMSGVIRYPSILRFRNDKEVTPEDLRLEQIPGFVDTNVT